MSGLPFTTSPTTVLAPHSLSPQAWLAAIIDSSDDAIISKTLQGVITTWNKGAERIFGFTADEVIGKPILVIIPTERHHEEPVILERLRNGDRIDHFETVRQRKDGTRIDISVTVSPVHDSDGKIVGISKIARDITLVKKVQRELEIAKESAERAHLLSQQARQEAEAANRAKDHFLSVLSHELRTPLTPVLGAISLIETSNNLPPEMREQISMVRRNIETEARLVDDLLDLTRIVRGKMSLHFEAVDAHSVVRNVIAMFQSEIDEKSLALTTALRAREFYVWADPGRFQQVILNLLSNAVKFTPSEGSISIRSSNDNGDFRLEVTDTGVGIEPDVMPRLFRAFEQGERSFTRRFGGLGLGLSIVKSLMELHKGSVTVVSKGRDSGSTFTVRLPATAPLRSSKDQSPGAVIPSKTRRRVLLVEDHQDTRDVMTALLRSFGCSVVSAGSVKEAISLANENEKFDLLISDFGLPDGTGSDVMKGLKHLHPINAIAITGFGQDEDILRSKEAGFAVHLTKPIHIHALREAIQQVTS